MIAEAEAVAVNYLELVEKLPDDGILTLSDVSWEEYENLCGAAQVAGIIVAPGGIRNS